MTRIIMAIAAWTCAAAAPGGVVVRATVEPSEIPYHRQACYALSVEAPDVLDVVLPDMAGRFGKLSVVKMRHDTTPLPDGRRRIVDIYTLEAVFPGEYPIDGAQVTWGESSRAEVPPTLLRVRELTDAERETATQFESIAGPPPAETPRPIRWILAGLAVSVSGAAVAAFCLRRRSTAPASEVRPPTPWEIACLRLRELDTRRLAESRQFERYYVVLSAILRHYIEERFQLRAPEQTTPEFLAAAARSDAFDSALQAVVADVLRHADRVKFARSAPTADDVRRDRIAVQYFVDATMSAPDPIKKSAPETTP